MKIFYSHFKTKFGNCLVASTDKGISNVIFAKEKKAVSELRSRWKKAELVCQEQPMHELIRQYFSDFKPNKKIRFYLQGTDFQRKVWKALKGIPKGKTSTYSAIAKQVGHPRALQATGSAIGANPIAYLIPCHRVLRSDGGMGGYRWGLERKREMLSWEADVGIS
jgi:AraC family transcriptional regulator of adaptative response/methylated-DNA-[protein]-cysteine methyltransferase